MNLNVSNSLIYTCLFKEPSFKSVQAGGSEYTTINMPGCLTIGKQAGDPAMPVKFIKLLLPPQKTVESITVTGTSVELNTKGIDLTTQYIYPYQNEIPVGSNVPQEFIMN
jgi:hypothetical protein